MCDTCGCSDTGAAKITVPEKIENKDHSCCNGLSEEECCDEEHEHGHHHDHDHKHHHHHHHNQDHSHERELNVQRDIMGKNDMLAERNRGYFDALNILAINLVSSPGAGKTSLLERTLADLGADLEFYVVEGDQQTMNDADRIKRTGTPVVQVNTGDGCHLDADMVNQSIKALEVKPGAILMVENVGNLVCPALFDLGEAKRVVIISVPEGDDKPAKYPNMFHTSDVCIINKTDLLPYVDFDVNKAKDYALRLNPEMIFFELSAKTGEGLDKWYDWLKKQRSDFGA